ncbi:uncharacterized protein K452DRAFT_301661 [Aplosporella prunicola CBS 121167]|uniref:Uncharacterized protein n=1 Tax=Aplosporella prunicola CBS 121167 TaxID=1176127 RepID=A0A6A6B2A4_9PEZI|nr:uncharacterized protein K452DRAFT_301661 [Aplosporella prunicola CBS 121167]KAF2137946.1 hypothetical protein K452DRAFT_301661 [Aplosporella prunicola CBS 121167]
MRLLLLRVRARALPTRLLAPTPASSRSLRSHRSRRLQRPPIEVAGHSRPTEPPPPRQDASSSHPDPLGLLNPEPAEPVVRFYEQDVTRFAADEVPRRVSATRVNADEDRARELMAKIRRLESEIELLENDTGDVEDPVLMRLRAVANDELDPDIDTLAEADPESVRRELDGLMVKLPPSGAAPTDQTSLARLNNCLRHAYLATDPARRPTIRQELWKAYRRAKLRVPGLLPAIPTPTWDILFYSQAVRWRSNKQRDQHVSELLEDMKSVGMDGPPTPPPEGNDPAGGDGGAKDD